MARQTLKILILALFLSGCGMCNECVVYVNESGKPEITKKVKK